MEPIDIGKPDLQNLCDWLNSEKNADLTIRSVVLTTRYLQGWREFLTEEKPPKLTPDGIAVLMVQYFPREVEATLSASKSRQYSPASGR